MSDSPTTPENLIDVARRLAQCGLATIPIPHGAKGPRLPGWPQLATMDLATHAGWFVDACSNIGIATGQKSNVFALDVDKKSGGLQTLEELEQRHGKLPKTALQRTGGGGLHYLFRWPADLGIKNAAAIAPGLDIRGEGGVIVAAPSLHASGERYAWLEGCAPWEMPIAEAPSWLLEMLQPKKKLEAAKSVSASKIVVDPEHSPNYRDEPSSAEVVVAGCAAIASVYENPESASEWLWKKALAIIGRTKNGRELAHHMSRLDLARYSEHDTDKQLDRLLADPRSVFTCKSIAETVPTICSQCPFRLVITTPLQLGREDKRLIELQRRHFYATDAEAYYDLERQLVKKSKDFASTYAHRTKGSAHLEFIRSRTAPKVDTLQYLPGSVGVIIKDSRKVLIGNTYLDDGVSAVEGNFSLLQEHFEYIVPNDEGQLDHLLNAMANMLQRPSQKLRHAILLKGGQRTGKSTIARFWGALLGPSNFVTIGKDELESTFQGGVFNKQLAVFEELFIKGRDRYNDLKDFISEDSKRAQKKNVDFYLARTPFAIIALSNHELPIMIPEADDGRWYVIESEAQPREAAYYERLNREGMAQLGAFKHALLNRDINAFNPNSPPPMTRAKLAMISDSRAPLEKALDDAIEELGRPVVLAEWLSPALLRRNVYPSASQLRDALRKLGAEPLGQVRMGQVRVSPWAVRDVEEWKHAVGSRVAEQLRGARERVYV